MTEVYYFGLRADEDDPDGTVHASDGSNYPFHPISLCGETLTRDLSSDKPKDLCGNCESILNPKTQKSETAKDGNG